MLTHPWNVYIIECSDGTLYTGITTDVDRRIREHNSGKGARYTSGRCPVRLLGHTAVADRSSAAKLEAHIKRQPKGQKLAMLMSSRTTR